jgi:2-polyprenyl-3-methyl-5-hydroxy-6-metoxy-1,4-benzoquinol methylase
METRDYNLEARDGARKYAYEFDDRLRAYTLRTLEPFIQPGRALELGCYKGDTTERLARRFSDLTVVDASDELIAAAAKRVPPSVRFVCATFEQVEFAGGFDSIFLLHTLEHLDEPVEVLRRIGSWLAPGGRLFVAVPNAHAPSRLIAVEMGLIASPTAVTDGERAQGHRRTYTLEALERDAVGAGYSVVHRGGVFFKPLANFQFDAMAGGDVISEAYLEGCYKLGARYPDLCASVVVVCER